MAPTSTEPDRQPEAGSSYGPDVLGSPYEARTLELTAADDGPLCATLVRRRAGTRTRKAVLHVHGFSDYFFNTDAAERWVDRGYDFYALDLRRYGRSMRPGQRPGFVADLSEYDDELDLAWAEVTADHDHVVLSAHSTGGLTVPLWVERRRTETADALAGLVLNAPWLDMHGSLLVRQLGMPVLETLGRFRPVQEIPRSVSGFYARSLHRDHQGEWLFDLTMKPIESFPVFAAWLGAIRRGQRTVARGLDIDVPVLVLCSTASGHPTSIDDPVLRTTDVVLDVDQIRRRSPMLGRHVTLVMVEGALHEVMLSAEPVRKVVHEEIDRFLAAYLDAGTATEKVSRPVGAGP